MMRLKSQSLPETERNKRDFSLVAKGSNTELTPNSVVRRSNSALPQSSQEIRSAGKQAATKSKGAKRWKLLRMLTLVTRRNKNSDNRKRAGTGESTKSLKEDSDDFTRATESSGSNTEIHFDERSKVQKITITKPFDAVETVTQHSEAESFIENEKRIVWDEATIFETPNRKISTESQYNISNRALAAAVGKWKQSIRSTSSTEVYETTTKGIVPRRAGVCEELEKTVVSDGTTLHELRKDLTVYLTLDELGML